MAKTNKCNSYVINGQKINVNDIIKHYNGNLGMACNEISQKTLVSFETAKYYVELCQKDEPFVKQNSTASFTSGILIAVPLIMFIATKIGFFPVDNDLFIAMEQAKEINEHSDEEAIDNYTRQLMDEGVL